tara:strand:+ start:4262 stop:5551 length:1290 start_codon:yes stop_codon:yes gene_type:complete
MMVGGPEGSTAGMRFNPRQSAEELQDDSSVGREDSEERALHDAKKREKQEKRAKMMQGLQHMKIKIPQKRDDEEDSDMKRQAEAGQMSGQVGQNEAIDGANPRGSFGGGAGMNMLLSTAPFIDDAFESIRKAKKNEPKYDDEKPKKTTTLETQQARARAKKGRRKKKYGMKDTESAKRSRSTKKRRLKGGNVRTPSIASTMSAARAPYVSFGLMGSRRPSPTGPRFLTFSTGRTQARTATNPQKKVEQDLRQAMRQDTPTQDITPPIPTVSPQSRVARAPRGSRDSRPHKKALRQPRTAATPGGKEASEATSLAGGSASAMAAGGIGSSDAILASEEFLHKRAQKLKLGISHRDRIEYRQLIDQLNHLLRRLMRKEDKSMQGADEKSSPNSSGGLTSNPTGATETDPDDDATRWGAHPYDLYVRRGGVG